MRDSLTVEIVKTRREASDIKTLYFVRPFDFIAGQYITVYFDSSKAPAGKAYSLSSRPSDELASITVKDVGGEFSSRLCALKKGDVLHISRAYGHFNPQTNAPLVGIAAGVGLSPIWSILAHGDHAQHQLHYTNTHESRIVFANELAQLKTCVQHYITRQPDTRHHSGRFNIENIVSDAENEAHFLICGSVDFVRDCYRRLVQQGVDKLRISTEIFFER